MKNVNLSVSPVVPGSTRPSREEKMLLSRTGVMALCTDILTLRPELNSGPTTQLTYGSRPRHDGGQDGPDSWLKHRNGVRSQEHLGR